MWPPEGDAQPSRPLAPARCAERAEVFGSALRWSPWRSVRLACARGARSGAGVRDARQGSRWRSRFPDQWPDRTATLRGSAAVLGLVGTWLELVAMLAENGRFDFESAEHAWGAGE